MPRLLLFLLLLAPAAAYGQASPDRRPNQPPGANGPLGGEPDPADAMADHNYELAATLYLQIADKSVSNRVLAAQALLYAGRLPEAHQQAALAVSEAPNSVEAHRMLGEVALKQEALDEAEAQYRWVVATAPDEIKSHFDLCALYYARQEKNRCDDELKTALHVARTTADIAAVKAALGWSELNHHRLDSAKKWLTSALAMGNRTCSVFDALAYVADRQDNIPAALRWIRKSLAVNPQCSNKTDNVYSTESDWVYSNALESEAVYQDKNAVIWQWQDLFDRECVPNGNRMFQDRAEKHLAGLGVDVTCKVRPAEDLFNAAWEDIKARRLAEASDKIEKGIALTPDLSWGYDLRASVYEQESDLERAIQNHQYAISIETDAREKALLLSNLSECYVAVGHLEEAASILEQARSLAPNDPAPYYELSLLNELQGHPADALSLSWMALARDPKSKFRLDSDFMWPEYRFVRDALAAQAHGNTPEAIAQWSALLKLEQAGQLHLTALAGHAAAHLRELAPSSPALTAATPAPGANHTVVSAAAPAPVATPIIVTLTGTSTRELTSSGTAAPLDAQEHASIDAGSHVAARQHHERALSLATDAATGAGELAHLAQLDALDGHLDEAMQKLQNAARLIGDQPWPKPSEPLWPETRLSIEALSAEARDDRTNAAGLWRQLRDLQDVHVPEFQDVADNHLQRLEQTTSDH